MKIKQNDIVRVTNGKFKGKIAKVVKVHTALEKVALEGLNVKKRTIKPSQFNPQGGSKEVHIPIAISNVALVVDGKDATSKVKFDIKKDGSKVRVAKSNGKEIK